MKREMEYIKCPFCKSAVEIDVEFAAKNGRVFCNGCCKAFDVKIQKATEDDDIQSELLRKHFERKELEEAKVEEVETEEDLSAENNGYYDWDNDF